MTVETHTSRYCGWHSKALQIASEELDRARGNLAEALSLVEDALLQVEDADKVSDPHEVFYMQLADDGEAIRKWSRAPFVGGRKCRVALP